MDVVDLRDAIVLAITRGNALVARQQRRLEAPDLAGKRTLGHLQPASGEPGDDIRAFVWPGDESILIAIVPTVEHELVDPCKAIFEVADARLTSGPRCDELVHVPQRALHQRKSKRGVLDRIHRHGRCGVDSRVAIVEHGLDAIVKTADRSIAISDVSRSRE